MFLRVIFSEDLSLLAPKFGVVLPADPRFLSDFISALSSLLHWGLSLVGTSEGASLLCCLRASHYGGLIVDLGSKWHVRLSS